jgi:hypothetical protein
MGTPVSIARRKAPSLNGSMSAVGERVPSGKIITETRCLRTVRQRWRASTALRPSPRRTGMSPAEAPEPAQHRNLEELGSLDSHFISPWKVG